MKANPGYIEIQFRSSLVHYWQFNWRNLYVQTNVKMSLNPQPTPQKTELHEIQINFLKDYKNLLVLKRFKNKVKLPVPHEQA